MKKKILALSLACAMSLGLLAGCGGGSEASPDPSAAPSAAAGSSTPAESGTLTVSLSSSPSKLDPIHYTGTYESQIIGQVCDRLIEYNDDLDTYVPSLATSWTISEDGSTYVFQIRQGVHFQNGQYSQGREMTAEDVAWSLNRSAQYSDMARLSMLDKAEVTGEWEVTCTLKSPNAAFLTALTDAGNSIIAQEEVEGWGDDFGYHLTGTGAFIMEDFQLDEQAVLVANEDYWLGVPNIQKLVFRFISDPTQTANALLAGDDLGTYYACFNNTVEPFDDPLVRQALIQAVDLDAVRTALYQYGEAEAACLPLPYGSWGYDESLESLALPYDVEAAKEKLAQSGYPNGFEVDIYVSNTQERTTLCTLLQAYWSQIGVTTNIHANEWGTFSDMAASGNADIYAMSWTWYPDPYFFLNNLFSSSQTSSNGNGALYINDEVDAALQAAVETTDQTERAAYYSEVMRHAMEDYTGIYYAVPYNCYGINSRVQDVTPRADGTLRFIVSDGEKIVRNTSVA